MMVVEELSNQAKKAIRIQVWRLMEDKGVASFPRPIYGRIPNFVGAKKAAENLRTLPEYQRAKTVFCNPDSPQRPVREMSLRDGKTLVMATPGLRRGFLTLDPSKLSTSLIKSASTIRGAFKYGKNIEAPRVDLDLFITGSVAVSLDGWRVGKGTGYSDKEYAILKSNGMVTSGTSVVTTVHDLQIVEEIPSSEWDLRVDVIVTPTRVIRVGKL